MGRREGARAEIMMIVATTKGSATVTAKAMATNIFRLESHRPGDSWSLPRGDTGSAATNLARLAMGRVAMAMDFTPPSES